MRREEREDLFDAQSLAREGGRRVLLLSAVGLLSAALTLVSFFAWRSEHSQGDIARAASRLEEFLSENEAIAVFLGWEEGEDADAP